MAAFWLTRLAILTVNVLMAVLLVKSNSDFCASVFETQFGHALVGHVMNTSTVADKFECHQKCLGNNSCKSFNVHPGADITKRVCELNNKTRKMKPNDFIKKKGSSYYGHVKVTCQDLATNKKKQTGHCHPGYEGKRCEIRIKRGLHSKRPAHSCKSIRDSGDSKGDGRYWIDPENSGNPLKVYCDMTTDGGGWLLVSNITRESSTPLQHPVKTSYRGITSDQMVLTKTAMNELITHLSFTQLRFHCSINVRTFHVTTAANSTGEAVVQYFSGQTDVQPASCGSYVRMENDNSGLAGVCKKWGWKNESYEVGKWGHGLDQDRLYKWPTFVINAYYWRTSSEGDNCDDQLAGSGVAGFWKIYVR